MGIEVMGRPRGLGRRAVGNMEGDSLIAFALQRAAPDLSAADVDVDIDRQARLNDLPAVNRPGEVSGRYVERRGLDRRHQAGHADTLVVALGLTWKPGNLLVADGIGVNEC